MEGREKPCKPMVSQASVPCADNSTVRLSSSDHGSQESEQQNVKMGQGKTCRQMTYRK